MSLHFHIVKLYLELDDNANKNELMKKISKFQDNSNIHDAGNNLVVHLNDPLMSNDKKKIKKIEKKYKMPGIKTIVSSTVKEDGEGFLTNVKHKNLHCFFDIDSTLTNSNGVINNRIRKIFEKMKNEHNMRIYFASGRNIPQILKDMEDFDTEPYGIAENGGVIIGLGNKGELLFGNRKEPDILDEYLKYYCPKIKEDIKQGFRKTERIYLQIPEVTRKQLSKYVQKSNAKVEVQISKNSYHVSKKNVNKGTAIEKFTTEMQFGPNDIIIAVGDADMDVSMIKNAQVGFAVGNASSMAIKAADIPLTNEHDKGIQEMYAKLLELI